MTQKWDRRFIQLAKLIADWSKDPSTKVGCVVVGEERQIICTGFNGFPRGVEDRTARLENRAEKYTLIVHAEANAVAQAARLGTSILGCTIYTTFPPCSACARSLIQSGITRVCSPSEADIPERWRADMSIAYDLFAESGVRFEPVRMEHVEPLTHLDDAWADVTARGMKQ